MSSRSLLNGPRRSSSRARRTVRTHRELGNKNFLPKAKYEMEPAAPVDEFAKLVGPGAPSYLTSRSMRFSLSYEVLLQSETSVAGAANLNDRALHSLRFIVP